MRAWLRERPWVWIVVFFAVLVAACAVMVVIAELNRPEIVRTDSG
jgi:hypothetical protein